MRSEKNGDSERAARGITPCVGGDSLLKRLTEAGKFAGDFRVGRRNFFRRVQLQLFRQQFSAGEAI